MQLRSYAPIIVTPHPLQLGRAEVGIGGDLQELFNKSPHPGDDFMLQIPHKSPIIPLVRGGEMQKIESKKLRSN